MKSIPSELVIDTALKHADIEKAHDHLKQAKN